MAKRKIDSFPIDLSDLNLLKFYYPSLKFSVISSSPESDKIKLIIEGIHFSKSPKQTRQSHNRYVANIVVTVENQNGINLNYFPKRVKTTSDGTFGKLEAIIGVKQILKIYATDEYTNTNTPVYMIELKGQMITWEVVTERSFVQSVGGG